MTCAHSNDYLVFHVCNLSGTVFSVFVLAVIDKAYCASS